MTRAEQEQWLRENTFPCKRLRARISPAACAAFREGNQDREAAYWQQGKRYKRLIVPGLCQGCDISDQAIKRSSVQALERLPKEETMSRGTCRECKREITMRGNGLCHRCYNAAKRAEVNPTPALPLSGEGAASAGFVPDLEMVNKAMRRGSSATIPPDKGGSRGVEIMPDVRVILPMQHLLVSFVERDAELFKRLEERAFAARRSPEQQILYVLDHYLSIMQNQEDSQWKAA